jgi:hypothetical protein
MSVKLCSLYTLEREPVSYELEIHYTYHPYQPARGPSYASGGEPEEYAFVEIDRVECEQGMRPFELTDAEEECLLDWLLGEAQDELIARADDAADYRYQQLKEPSQ